MLHVPGWRASTWVLAHAGLLALGCGITERRVHERDEVIGVAGATSGDAGGVAGSSVGAAAGSGGGRDAGGVGGKVDVPPGPGVELDPVDVGEAPTGPCSCGTGCTIQECDASTVAQPNEFLMNVAARDGQLYWMSQHDLGRTTVGGGFGSSIASDLKVPSRVVVDASFVFFVSYQGLWKVQRQAVGVTLIGTGSKGAELLATLSPWDRRLTEIAVDSRDVYWTAPGSGLGPAQLKRTPIDGSASVTLARLPNDDDWPLGVAVDDVDVYFTSNAALQRVSKADDGGVEQLEAIGTHVDYEMPHPLLGIALDRDYVYFDAGGALRRRSKRGPESIELLRLQPGDELRGVVVDRDYAYVATRSGDIVRVPKLGGTASVMVSGEQNPLVTSVDVSFVYWVEQEAGRIRMAMK
jgi:hypothetical protein